MRNVYFLVKKNLRLLIRSKGSALIVILAPLMLILLIGMTYNTSKTGLNIGIISSEYTPEINSFINLLQEEDYKIVKYEQSKECVEDIKLDYVHTCVVLPKNFQLQDNSQKEIIFYIDQTKINLVYIITDTLNKKFNLKSVEMSQEIVSDIMSRLVKAQARIQEKSVELDKAKAKNQEAVTKSNALKSDLDTLDFNAPNTNYDFSKITTLKQEVTTKASTAFTSLSTAKTKVTASALNSTEKTGINSNIDDASTKLGQLVTVMNGTGSGTLEEISNLVSSIQKDLNTTKNKLTTAASKVSTTGTQLNNINSNLNEGITSVDSVKTTLTEIQKDLSGIKVTNSSTIAMPVVTKIEKVTVEKTYLNYLFPSLIVLVIMFVSILLGTTLVMMEKHNPAYFRNFIMPVRKFTFIFSTYLTNCFIILIQITIILGISLLFLETTLEKLPIIALILLAASSVFTLMGMVLGYLFESEDTGTLASISMGSLLLFVSGVVLPLESMPNTIRHLTYFNPFVISEKLVKEVFIFNTPFSILLEDLLILVAYAIVLTISILIIDSIASKHFITKMMYKHHKHVREKEEHKK